ncbi:TetR/AcrR family transcriptional regulator [Streptomyces sp. NPDC053431]|uniref:TetR/AcrR family transcriptional regulator n=1 Tax=Streptomyces sp. NPDC053431 TaxID=3365703 RepID=UPI0037D4A950
MGRTSTAKERLVDVTGELLRGRGYGSLGVAEICARADVKKGSFYYFFESKQALTVEVLDAYWREERAAWTAGLTASAPALDRLRTLLERASALQRRGKEETGTVDGCLLGNLALELSTQEPDVRDRLDAIFDEQIELIAGVLAEAAEEGAIPADRAGTPLARAIVAQLEGLVLLAKLKNDPAVLDGLWPQVRMLLGA